MLMADQTAIRQDLREVDVCVCTFRRASVTGLLASLAKQDLGDFLRMRVIVADNDDAPSARQTVEAAFGANGLDGVYVHAPARNISVARNACLQAARAPMVAFIDDDEIARPGWLAGLVAAMDVAKSDVVFGKVNAAYAADAPRWMRAADLHSTPAPFRNGVIDGGYTCNVLMRRGAVGALRFDPTFGRSGGEDTTFFAAMRGMGAVMTYTADAVVDEPVTKSRSSLAWLTQRAYRSGQTYGLLRLGKGESRSRIAAVSLAKIVWCFAAAALTIWSPAQWRKSAVRAYLHAGVLGAATGRAPLELYGAASG
jgi:succinoglycan biosynthesis protein ExoM